MRSSRERQSARYTALTGRASITACYRMSFGDDCPGLFKAFDTAKPRRMNARTGMTFADTSRIEVGVAFNGGFSHKGIVFLVGAVSHEPSLAQGAKTLRPCATMRIMPRGERQRRTKGEGTIRWRSDGRCEGREPPETVPPGERPRSVYGRSE